MSDATRIVSLMTRPDVGLVKGHVTGKEDRNWLIGHSLKSFSIMTDEREVLVTLPRTAMVNLEIGSEVWVIGQSLGPLRLHAEMIFLPRLQQRIDLAKQNSFPRQPAIIVALVGLMVLVQNPMWVIYYIGIPLFVGLFVYERHTVRPRLCTYEAWEMIEPSSERLEQELPQVRERAGQSRSVIGVLTISAWILSIVVLLELLVPLFTTYYYLSLSYFEAWVFTVSMNVAILFVIITAAVDLTWDVGKDLRGGP